jgi:hypothetical protein
MGICTSEQKVYNDRSESSSVRIVNMYMDPPVKSIPFDQITVQSSVKHIVFEKEGDEQKYKRMNRESIKNIRRIYLEEYNKTKHI